MSYNLRDYENEWVKLEISIDNTNNAADLFINGAKKDSFVFAEQITKNTNSKFFVGGNSEKSKNFRGKMESLSITNKLITEKIANSKYISERNSKNKMLDLKFKNNGVTDSSKFKVAKKNKANNGTISNVLDVIIKAVDNRYAVQFVEAGEFIEMEPTSSMSGDKLDNTTFSAWIKTPDGYANTGYEPILSRNGIFSFGLNNGHASLFLGKDNQLVPGTNITVPQQNTDVIVSTDDKIVNVSFEEIHSKVDVYSAGVKVASDTKTHQSGVLSTNAIQLSSDTDDKIELDKSLIVGKDLKKFSVSMWVNFDTLTDNMILMQRPDIGLKLSGDSTGKMKVEYKKLIENKIQLFAYFGYEKTIVPDTIGGQTVNKTTGNTTAYTNTTITKSTFASALEADSWTKTKDFYAVNGEYDDSYITTYADNFSDGVRFFDADIYKTLPANTTKVIVSFANCYGQQNNNVHVKTVKCVIKDSSGSEVANETKTYNSTMPDDTVFEGLSADETYTIWLIEVGGDANNTSIMYVRYIIVEVNY